MSDILGNAFIEIIPDFSKFEKELTKGTQKAVAKIEKDLALDIEANADLDKFEKALSKGAQRAIDRVEREAVLEIKAAADFSQVEKDLKALNQKLERSSSFSFKAQIDTSDIEKNVKDAATRVQKSVKVDLETTVNKTQNQSTLNNQAKQIQTEFAATDKSAEALNENLQKVDQSLDNVANNLGDVAKSTKVIVENSAKVQIKSPDTSAFERLSNIIRTTAQVVDAFNNLSTGIEFVKQLQSRKDALKKIRDQLVNPEPVQGPEAPGARGVAERVKNIAKNNQDVIGKFFNELAGAAADANNNVDPLAKNLRELDKLFNSLNNSVTALNSVLQKGVSSAAVKERDKLLPQGKSTTETRTETKTTRQEPARGLAPASPIVAPKGGGAAAGTAAVAAETAKATDALKKYNKELEVTQTQGNRFQQFFSGAKNKVGDFAIGVGNAKDSLQTFGQRLLNTFGILQDAGSKTSTASKGIKDLVKNFIDLEGVALGAGIALAAFGVKAGQAIIGLAREASNLQESQNAISVTLGDADDKFRQLIGTTADLGLTQNQLGNSITPIIPLLKNAGLSGEDLAVKLDALVRRAVDLGSIFNRTTDDVLPALGAALRGETEPAERLGIAFNALAVDQKALELGFEKTKGQYTEQAKALARLQLIMEKSTFAAGDYSKTSDGLANASRNLSAKIAELRTQFSGVFLKASEAITASLARLVTVIGPIATRFFADLEPLIREFGRALSGVGIELFAQAFVAAGNILNTFFPIVKIVVTALTLLLKAVNNIVEVLNTQLPGGIRLLTAFLTAFLAFRSVKTLINTTSTALKGFALTASLLGKTNLAGNLAGAGKALGGLTAEGGAFAKFLGPAGLLITGAVAGVAIFKAFQKETKTLEERIKSLGNATLATSQQFKEFFTPAEIKQLSRSAEEVAGLDAKIKDLQTTLSKPAQENIDKVSRVPNAPLNSPEAERQPNTPAGDQRALQQALKDRKKFDKELEKAENDLREAVKAGFPVQALDLANQVKNEEARKRLTKAVQDQLKIQTKESNLAALNQAVLSGQVTNLEAQALAAEAAALSTDEFNKKLQDTTKIGVFADKTFTTITQGYKLLNDELSKVDNNLDTAIDQLNGAQRLANQGLFGGGKIFAPFDLDIKIGNLQQEAATERERIQKEFLNTVQILDIKGQIKDPEAFAQLSSNAKSLFDDLLSSSEALKKLDDEEAKAKLVTDAQTKATQDLEKATKELNKANEDRADLQNKLNTLLSDTARRLQDIEEAQEEVTLAELGIQDALAQQLDLRERLNELQTPATAEQIAAATDNVTKAEIALRAAIRERDKAEQNALPTQRIAVNLAGLSADQIRTRLANLRQVLKAQKSLNTATGQEGKTAEEIADEKLTNEINVREAERSLNEAKAERIALEDKVKNNAEEIAALNRDLARSVIEIDDAQENLARTQAELTRQKSSDADVDREIKALREQIAAADERIANAQKSQADAQKAQVDAAQKVVDKTRERLELEEKIAGLIAQQTGEYDKAIEASRKLFENDIKRLQELGKAPADKDIGPGFEGNIPLQFQGLAGKFNVGVRELNNALDAQVVAQLLPIFLDLLLKNPKSPLNDIFKFLGVPGFKEGGVVEGHPSAFGKMIRVAEMGKREAILPLMNAQRMQTVVNDPRVLGPVLNAIGTKSQAAPRLNLNKPEKLDAKIGKTIVAVRPEMESTKPSRLEKKLDRLIQLQEQANSTGRETSVNAPITVHSTDPKAAAREAARELKRRLDRL